jgi:probable O-glycosylation ligase (exosortase A-associated)
MKQLIFMIALTLIGVVGSLTISPFYGLAVYYLFAILRPQFMWWWSLPAGVPWSLYVAWATIAATLLGVRPARQGQGGVESPIPERPRWNSAHVLVLLFGVWICVSFLVMGPSELGTLYMVDYAKHFTMFIIASLVIRSVRQVWILVLIAASALGYIAYEVNYLYFVNGYLGIARDGYGGTDNNGAGLLLALGVPLCYFAWEGLRKWWRWLYLGLIPVLIHAVLMTYSRGAMVSLLVCSPLFFFRSRKRLHLAVIAVAVAALVPFLAGKEIRARFFTIEKSDEDASAQSRFQSWEAGWRIAQDYPIFGAGVRKSMQLVHQYGMDMENRAIHDQYLQIAADNGFVGAGLYMAALGATWWGLRRVRRATKSAGDPESCEAYAAACGIEGALLVFCTAAIFLSCEMLEAQYILILLGAQLPAVTSALVRQEAHAPEPEALKAIAAD